MATNPKKAQREQKSVLYCTCGQIAVTREYCDECALHIADSKRQTKAESKRQDSLYRYAKLVYDSDRF